MQILEVSAESFSSEPGRVCFEEFGFDVVPALLVEPDDVVEGVVPGHGPFPKAHVEFVRFPLRHGPSCYSGGLLQPFDQLLWCYGVPALI